MFLIYVLFMIRSEYNLDSFANRDLHSGKSVCLDRRRPLCVRTRKRPKPIEAIIASPNYM